MVKRLCNDTYFDLRHKDRKTIRQNEVEYHRCPHSRCVSLSKIINFCAKRTILLRQNFVMPRLCYGSAEQVNLLCSHLNRKVHFSVFTFHFSVFTFPFPQISCLYQRNSLICSILRGMGEFSIFSYICA